MEQNVHAQMNEQQEIRNRVAKPLLWVSIVGMVMFFAGFTSYYLIRHAQGGWAGFEFPQPFFISTIFIVLSSISLIIAKLQLNKGNQKVSTNLILTTFILGLGFCIQQFKAYGYMVDQGFFFAGPESNVSYSILYVITFAHFLHVSAGMIVLAVTFVKSLSGSYTPKDKLGFELAEIFWHFLGVLWLYLLFFLVFIR